MTPLAREKYGPWLLGILAAVLWALTGPRFPSDANAIFGGALTFGSILTGFLASAKAVLVSLRGSAVYARLQKQGFMTHILGYLASAIGLALASCVISMVGFFVDPNNGWYGPLWVAFEIATIAGFIRVTSIFFSILRHPLAERSEP